MSNQKGRKITKPVKMGDHSYTFTGIDKRVDIPGGFMRVTIGEMKIDMSVETTDTSKKKPRKRVR